MIGRARSRVNRTKGTERVKVNWEGGKDKPVFQKEFSRGRNEERAKIRIFHRRDSRREKEREVRKTIAVKRKGTRGNERNNRGLKVEVVTLQTPKSREPKGRCSKAMFIRRESEEGKDVSLKREIGLWNGLRLNSKGSKS